MLGTLCGLRKALQNLSPGRKLQFRVHATLLDIHEAIIARDLCMLMLLHDLNNTIDGLERTEIHATLMYTFAGAVMPAYCYNRCVECCS